MKRSGVVALVVMGLMELGCQSQSRSSEKLNTLLERYDAEVTSGKKIDQASLDQIDHTAGQKDAIYSRLYWYTDLELAKSEAARERKPILSLRLLGKLDEEMSCANSRFFRTILYSNKNVSDYLREHYILHWQTVRDVPMMTIDFSDGRQIVRPITGNSMHMILDEKGSVQSVIPGLYSPKRFMELVSTTSSLAVAPKPSGVGSRVGFGSGKAFDAVDSGRLTGSKFVSQAGSLREFGFRSAPTGVIADVEIPMSEIEKMFDRQSLDLISVKSGLDAHPEMKNELLSKLYIGITQDTRINDASLRPQIVLLLKNNPGRTAEEITNLIYKDVFKIPVDDPWAGLNPGNIYTGVAGNGIIDPVLEKSEK